MVHLYIEGGNQMKIWKLDFEVEYDYLEPIEESAIDVQSFDGKKMKDNWKPLPVRRMEPEKNLELSDYPGFVIPTFSKKALEILYPLIQNSSEYLDLLFQEKEYYGINVTTVLNVIDYSKSIYKMYSDGSRIMRFQKYAFRMCDDLFDNNIFKIIDEPRRRPFVSEKFKQTVEENKLTGFEFRLVWDSEEE